MKPIINILKGKKKPRPSHPYRTFPSAQMAIVAAICDNFDCNGGICNVVIPCKGIDFGKRIVKIFIARVDAADFANVTDLATASVWATRLAISCTGATATQRIVAIGDIHDGVKPKADTKIEEAPYGGDEVVETKQTVTFNIKRWDLALFDSINLLRCIDSHKMWYLTDTGYLFGDTSGFLRVSMVWGHLQHPGSGGSRVMSENTMTWLQQDQSKPVYAPFLATLNN